jgi:hypothetical protein
MKRIILLLATVMMHYWLCAQGCSDAGFCSIGNIKPAATDSFKQKITIALTNGIGDEGVYVLTPAIQYDRKINNRWAIQAKLTGNYATGNLGSATGVGDIFLSSTFTPKTNNKWKQHILLAAKIPLNSGNLKEGTVSLPMQYQSSLGTVDVIAGYSLTNEKWLFAAAWQQPVSGRNGNNFLPVYFNNAAALKYSPSNDFNRKADLLLRANYNFSTNQKFKFTAGLLGIYHTGNDTYIDGNTSSKPIEIVGSSGVTLNITAAGWYKFSNKFSLGLSAGAPAVVRDVRPDGLTRAFTIAPEFIFNF